MACTWGTTSVPATCKLVQAGSLRDRVPWEGPRVPDQWRAAWRVVQGTLQCTPDSCIDVLDSDNLTPCKYCEIFGSVSAVLALLMLAFNSYQLIKAKKQTFRCAGDGSAGRCRGRRGSLTRVLHRQNHRRHRFDGPLDGHPDDPGTCHGGAVDGSYKQTLRQVRATHTLNCHSKLSL